MAVIKLRQNTTKSLAYVGTNNAQCIYWDKVLAAFGLRLHVPPEGTSTLGHSRALGRAHTRASSKKSARLPR
jgi:hypothetical protein